MGTLPKKSTEGKQSEGVPMREPGSIGAGDIMKAGTGHVGVIAGIVLGAGAAGTDHVVAGMGIGAVCVVAAVTAFFAHRSSH
jgi:hypothetical protein